jgi:cytochrome c-type biogenesis protein CcmE
MVGYGRLRSLYLACLWRGFFGVNRSRILHQSRTKTHITHIATLDGGVVMIIHPVRRKKLIKFMLPVMVIGLVVGLVLYALGQNISLFYTPTQVLSGEAPKARLIHLGGRVVPGSVVRGDDFKVQFKLTDTNQDVTVDYKGFLPDLFREGQGIVTEGELLDNGIFKATQVLAKHDENYMSPEVKEALEKGQAARKKALL